VLEGYGYRKHIRHIRSFGKLTSESMTLIGGEMIRILEEVLPSRFGGTALDYQIVEEEDSDGMTRLNLLVSPDVPLDDESRVLDVVMRELQRGTDAADMAAAVWSQAGTLRVKRQRPVVTARGKLLPLHILRQPG